METGASNEDPDSQSLQSLCFDCLHVENTEIGECRDKTLERNAATSSENLNRTSEHSDDLTDADNADSLSESSWNELFDNLDVLFYEAGMGGERNDGDSPATDSSDGGLTLDDVVRLHRINRGRGRGTRAAEEQEGEGGYVPPTPQLPEIILDDFGEEEEEDDEDMSGGAAQVVPLYPMGKLEYTECAVCCDVVDLYLRACCDCPVCDACMLSYITIQVEEARVKMGCPNDTCKSFVHRDEIIVRLSGPVKEKFFRFLVDANKESNVKTCPKCSSVMTVDKDKVRRPDKMGVAVVCAECELEWCFVCQAPFHEKLSCKAFRRGDKLLQKWAKENHFGQANAQRCPKCKTFISRTSGCDHMTCSQCRTEFCYRCGGRFLSLRFLGDHYDRLSIFGCRYRLMPHRPRTRKLIRGSLFAGKVAIVPIVAGLAVGACAVLAAAGVVILPVFGGIRLHKWRKRKKAQKAAAEARREWRARLAEVRGRGDPYLERYRQMQLGNMDLSLHWYYHPTTTDSTDSLPDTSSNTDPPKETEHVASVHKSGSSLSIDSDSSSLSCVEATLNELVTKLGQESESMEKIGQGAEPTTELGQGVEPVWKSGPGDESVGKLGQRVESLTKLGQGAESLGKSGQGEEFTDKLGQGVECSSLKLWQEVEKDVEGVPLAQVEDLEDFESMESVKRTKRDCTGDVIHEDSADSAGDRRDTVIECTNKIDAILDSFTEEETKPDKSVDETKKEKEEEKKVKEVNTRKQKSPSLASSPVLQSAPLEKDEIILVQKPSKKSKEDDGCKVKSIVSQYSCLGGKSREEEEEEEEEVVVVEEKKTVGKLMIRSASYDVAIREAESGVSVRQMVKRYSQGAS